MMMKNNILAFFILYSFIFGQSQPITVAVLDFEAVGISLQEVQTLTERIRSEIGNTNAVRLIERKAVDKIMAEQGLQQSGCTSDECASEVGKLLGVQFMISGSIGLVGDTYTIDTKMFSVESGETVRTKSASYAGEISGLITEMEILAWEIVGLEAPGRLRLKRSGETDKSTVAVLDFEGRGISIQEAKTLTDRFTSSMSSTKRVIMVERGVMAEVLENQGLAMGECTSDECAAEVGAMLGVQFMVSGAIGKLGDTYTIDVKMFSVATGAAENMQSISYQGKVDGLITEIEIIGWTILGLNIPKNLIQKRRMGTSAYLAQQKEKTKVGAALRSVIPGLGQLYNNDKMFGYSFMGVDVLLWALTMNSQSTFTDLQSDQDEVTALYNAATQQTEIDDYINQLNTIETDLQKANDQLVMFSAAAIGVWAANIIHAYITGPSPGNGLSSRPLKLAYDPAIQKTSIQWTIEF